MIIAISSDYDPETNSWSIEAVIRDVMAINPQAVVVSDHCISWLHSQDSAGIGADNLTFSPEFLWEDKALITCIPRASSLAKVRTSRIFLQAAAKGRH